MAKLAEWADEDPKAMRRLLCDSELRAQLGAALDDLVPGPGTFLAEHSDAI